MADVITGLADDDIATEWRHETASRRPTTTPPIRRTRRRPDDADGVDPDEGPGRQRRRPDRLLTGTGTADDALARCVGDVRGVP